MWLHSVNIFTWQMWQLREVKDLAQGHDTRKQGSRDVRLFTASLVWLHRPSPTPPLIPHSHISERHWEKSVSNMIHSDTLQTISHTLSIFRVVKTLFREYITNFHFNKESINWQMFMMNELIWKNSAYLLYTTQKFYASSRFPIF